MKINYKVFKTLTGEPFKTQEINGKEVGFYKMNETNFLQENVSRGRFYLWTSDGNTYKLLVEEGFYNKVDYFFEQEINAVWINFLEDVSKINSRTSKMFLFGSLGISLLVIVGALLLEKFSSSESNFMTFGIVGALLLTMIGNMIHSSKVNKLVREKNLNAQEEIRNILSEEKFNQLLKDQDEYMKEYFKFEDDEDLEISDEELIEEVYAEVEPLVIEEEATKEVEVVEEITEEVKVLKQKEVKYDYNAHTVAELREIAKERELVGYSTLKKADLIRFIEEEENK